MLRKFPIFITVLLVMAFALVACNSGNVENAVNQAEEALEDAGVNTEAAAATAESVAEDVMEEVDEAMEDADEAMDEAMDEADEAMEEGEEMMDEGEEMMEDMDPCAPTEDGPLAGVDPRGVTFIWWHNHSGSREEKLQAIVDDFNATNPCEITVEALNQGSYNDIRDAVNSSIASGEVPATLVVGYQNDQAFYQLNETLVDLNTYVDDTHWGLSDDERGDFYASFFNQSIHGAFDDQRLGFPPNRSLELMHYNATYLADLGFDAAPATPDEFREMACAARDEVRERSGDDSAVGGYVLRDDASAMAAWTFAFGGDVVSEDGTEYVYNSDATVAAMTMLQEMFNEGCAYFFDGFPNPEVASRNALFAQGSSSGIPFYAGDFATVAEEQGIDTDVYAVAAVPHTTADPVVNVYGGDVMIVQTTDEEQLAAWMFIKWFTGPEAQAQWVEASNYFPTRAGTSEFLDTYIEENPVYGTAVDLLAYGAFEPQLISYTSVRDAAEEAFNTIMQGADAQETLDALTETANELQEELEAEIGG